MKCLEWKEKISGYIDREISPAEIREVEGHLAACESCRILERRMRALGVGVARAEAAVPSDFREKLFARLEAEELLPRRRSLFVFSLRWAAVPLAAAAAVGMFLLVSPEKGRDAIAPQQSTPSAVVGLSAEEREIVAYLEVLEDPAALEEQGDGDTMEMFAPSGSRRG